MIDKVLKAIRPWPTHPIDRLYGIETSRRVRRFFMRTGDSSLDHANVGYVGSQPSLIRTCLDLLPDLKGAVFFDLGCGKGRVLSVASEYPFASITGIEMSKAIFKVADRNAHNLARRHPDRTPIHVVNDNAIHPPLPMTGTAVVFLYNPFHGDVTRQLVANLEADLRERPDLKLFLVYYNPAHAPLLDGSAMFSRYYAELLHFSDEERDSSPFGNDYDSVVIWQSRTGPQVAPLPGAERRVEITVTDLVAMVRYDGEPGHVAPDA